MLAITCFEFDRAGPVRPRWCRMRGLMQSGTTGSMPIQVNIASVHCWAPNAAGAADWRAWLEHGSGPNGTDKPPLAHIKPMQRRRLSPLARCVFEVGARCLADVPADSNQNIGCLFACAYGQCDSTAKLLDSLAHGSATSPTAFSLSVHNAIAGQFSIAHGLTGSSSTMAPGRDGLGGVLLEATGILAEGRCEHLLVCCFEAPIPDSMKPYDGNPPTPMAAAFLLTPNSTQPEPEAAGVVLQMDRTVEEIGKYGTPFWKQVLEFTVFADNCRHATPADLVTSTGGVTYTWHCA